MSRKKRTKEQISYTMSRIRSKDTSIELTLRRTLWSKGFRYRKHYKRALGSPDIAFVWAKVAVFCDSSFWHGRDWKERKERIYSNRDYWLKKIEGNMARDKRVDNELRESGWVVLRFWDVEIEKNLSECIDKISNTLKQCAQNQVAHKSR